MKYEVKQGFVKAEDIKDDGMLMFFLSRNEVEVCATYRMEQQIEELRKLGTDAKNIMSICFMGYDNDPREVYDIPAVHEYLSKLLKMSLNCSTSSISHHTHLRYWSTQSL